MKITGVRTVTCDIPLARPIVMGDLRFESREYAIATIETNVGITGIGFGMTRNAPIGTIVDRNLAPLLLGADPLMTEELWERLYYRNLTIAGRGVFMRALSAVDVALWDVKAQVAGLPIWKLLGGARTRAPLTVAGGYTAAGKTNDDLAREVDDYVRRGFGMIKISAGDLAQDTSRLTAAAEAIGGRARLAYDAHWAWRTLFDVVPTVRSWEAIGLAFLEDPLRRSSCTSRRRCGPRPGWRSPSVRTP
jgi:D-arabinonate dehydratase